MSIKYGLRVRTVNILPRWSPGWRQHAGGAQNMEVLPHGGGGGAPRHHGGAHGAIVMEERVRHRDEELKIKDYTISHFY